MSDTTDNTDNKNGVNEVFENTDTIDQLLNVTPDEEALDERPFVDDNSETNEAETETTTDKETTGEIDDSPDFEESSNIEHDNTTGLKEPPSDHGGIIQRISWPGDRLDFDSDERLIKVANPHPIKHLPQYIAGTLMSIIAGFLSIHYLLGYTNNYLTSGNLPFGLVLEVTTQYFLALIGIIGLGIGVIIYMNVHRQHIWYIITNQRTYVRSGVLSKTDQGSLDHERINNVTEENPFPINRYGIGHIDLYTASTDGSEITIEYVKEPHTWKSQIRDQIQSEKTNNNQQNES